MLRNVIDATPVEIMEHMAKHIPVVSIFAKDTYIPYLKLLSEVFDKVGFELVVCRKEVIDEDKTE